MSFHLVGFRALTATAILQQLTAITDDVFGSEEGAFISSSDVKIIAGFAMGDSLQRATMSIPTQDSIVLSSPHIRPIVSSATMISDPNLAEWFDRPVPLRASEFVQIKAEQTSGGAADVRALLWFATHLDLAPEGEHTTIRATSVTATVANAWSDVSLTWENRPGRGRYAVIGAECVSSSPFAFRLKFDSQGYRPGGLSMSSLGDRPVYYFARAGKLGAWGYATEMVLPRLQVLSTAISSSHTLYVHLVRIA